MKPEKDVVYFESAAAFRDWLGKNGTTCPELWVGYHKKATGKPSLTWEASVDEALCFGWIDGLRKSVDAGRYKIRFTPRRKNSNWSAKNLKRVKELKKLGLMEKAGLAIYRQRKPSQECGGRDKAPGELDPGYVEIFKEEPMAWDFFQQLTPSVRRISIGWVMSAKREETRMKRLEILVRSSAAGEKIPGLQR